MSLKIGSFYNMLLSKYQLESENNYLKTLMSEVLKYENNQVFFEMDKMLNHYIFVKGMSKLDALYTIYNIYVASNGDPKEFIFSDKERNKSKEDLIKKEMSIYSDSSVFIEGVFMCNTCKSRKIRYTSMQISKGDEAETNKFECENGHIWFDS